MICDLNNSDCFRQGFCSCRRGSSEGVLAGLTVLIAGAVVLGFLYPAIKILRLKIDDDRRPVGGETEQGTASNGNRPAPKLVGALWLFSSPFFGQISTWLFTLLVALPAAARAGDPVVENYLNLAVYTIFLLAMGLALLAFLFKNRRTLQYFIAAGKLRSPRESAILIGACLVAIICAAFAVGIGRAAFAIGQLNREAQLVEINRESEYRQDVVRNLRKFDGKYRMTTRTETGVFKVQTDAETAILNLTREGGGGFDGACEVSLQINKKSVEFVPAGSPCPVAKKGNRLRKISFSERKGKIQMHFFYENEDLGDNLQTDEGF